MKLCRIHLQFFEFLDNSLTYYLTFPDAWQPLLDMPCQSKTLLPLIINITNICKLIDATAIGVTLCRAGDLRISVICIVEIAKKSFQPIRAYLLMHQFDVNSAQMNMSIGDRQGNQYHYN